MYSPSGSSSSSSSKRSPVHTASLVDPSTHSPALLELVDIKVSKPVIDYVVDCVADTVDYAMGRPPSLSRRHALAQSHGGSNFTTFVTNVITRAEVTTPVILASLVYIDRAKPHLHIALEEWAQERVFLGAIIVASKYCNDSTLKNQHWALCTGVFGKRDVGRIEREFLDVLDFELSITEDDVLSHHDGLTSISFTKHSHRHAHAHPHRLNHHHHQTQVPDLEPSTSDTSSGHSSPRTPSTLASPVPSAQKTKTSVKKSSAAFHDIIQSFPIPIPHRVSPTRPSRYSSFPPAPHSSSQHSHPLFSVSVQA